MKLDFLICGSPTQGFFSQIAFFRLCLNSLGGIYEDARLVAVFGDHADEIVPGDWRAYFDDIDVEWAHPIGASNPFYQAQHNRRFEIIRADADLAVLCDADVALIKPFDCLIENLVQSPALGGVIAHYHFPWAGRPRDPETDWPELANAVIGRNIERPNRYTLLGPEAAPEAPFYINYGMFAGPPDLLAEFYARDCILRPRVAELVNYWWAPQISLALTCADLELPTRCLPMRYNFPNDPIADRLYPEELEEATFFHYLRLKEFGRDEIFATPEKFEEFSTKSLTGSNSVFRDAALNITGHRFPFAT